MNWYFINKLNIVFPLFLSFLINLFCCSYKTIFLKYISQPYVLSYFLFLMEPVSFRCCPLYCIVQFQHLKVQVVVYDRLFSYFHAYLQFYLLTRRKDVINLGTCLINFTLLPISRMLRYLFCKLQLVIFFDEFFDTFYILRYSL